MMDTLSVKRLTDTARLPMRQTPGSAGYDLYADVEELTIQPGEICRIPTGIAIAIGDIHAAAHRAGAVGQGGDPGAHFTASHEPVLGTLYPLGRPQTDEQQQGHIGDQDDGNLHRDGFTDCSFQFSNTHRYFPLSLSLQVGHSFHLPR